MSSSVVGKGTILKVSISSTLTAIPNITRISGIQMKTQGIDVTALSDSFIQMKPAIPDLGNFTFSGNFDPANTVHQYLATSIRTASQTDESWEHTYPNSGPNKNTFTGPLLDFSVGDVDKNGVYPFSAAVHVNANTAS